MSYFARRIWRDNPWADGMVWNSAQDSSSHCFLLFGDRFNEGDLVLQKTQTVESDEVLILELENAARRGGIEIYEQ